MLNAGRLDFKPEKGHAIHGIYYDINDRGKSCSKEEIMETQITSENEMQPEAVPGVGEWQSKLAELLQYNQKMVGDAFLYSKKRRDVSARALQAGFVAIDVLRENSRLLVTYFKDHDTREAYAKDLYERLVK